MNEASAREVVLVRAIETRDTARAIFADADRDWASRAAAEVEGDGAPPDRYLARRASLALERVRGRHPALERAARAFDWRGWIGTLFAVAAFALGAATNELGPAQRVNVLAFPLIALLAWNLAVYAFVVMRMLSGAKLGGVRGWIARIAQRLPGGGRDGTASVLSAFTADWTALSARLTSARAARVLHVAAAAFALGAIAGMYLRGLAFEYRAGWESTFLDSQQVHALLAFVLAPGAWATGIAIPDVAHLEAIRFSATGGGELAAPWIHLYAATTVLVAIVPRMLLAALNGLFVRRRSAHFPLPLDDPYYARLLRGYGRDGARVAVVPYSYQLPAPCVQGLTALIGRTFGAHADIAFAPPVEYGAEDRLAEPGPADVVIALFNIAATPERENQSAFLAALASRIASSATLVAMIDEGDFHRRFAQQPDRIEQRRAAWREALSAQRIDPLFVDLAASDLRDAESALNAVLDRAAEGAA